MVRDDDQVPEVLAGPTASSATARPGTVVAVHSTVEPDTPDGSPPSRPSTACTCSTRPCRRRRMGAGPAPSRSWSAAPTTRSSWCARPSRRSPSLVVHLGPIGAGTRAKLARNLMHFVATPPSARPWRLAEAAGVDLAALGEVVRHTDAITGGPGAIMVRDTTPPLAPDDGLRAIFTHARALGEKDLQLALALGADLGVDLPVARLALDRLGTPSASPTSPTPPPPHDPSSWWSRSPDDADQEQNEAVSFASRPAVRPAARRRGPRGAPAHPNRSQEPT